MDYNHCYPHTPGHLQAVVGRDTTVFTTGSARCVTRDKIISAVT